MLLHLLSFSVTYPGPTLSLFCFTVFNLNLSFVCLCLYSGRESRLPLTIMGEAMGPKLQLNYNVMDLKNVFIGDKGCYEVRKVKPK